MELEQPMARGLPMLPRPRVLEQPPRGGWVSTAATESRLQATSLLSVAVQEMLVVHRGNLVVRKPPRGPSRLPPGDGAVGSLMAAVEEPAAMRAVKAAVMPGARTRQALAKRVARRMLRRGASPSSASASPDHERRAVVLTCCCPRLPRGLRCTLHQRGSLSWTRGAAAGEAAVAPRAYGSGRWAFSEYARWRRTVWMPSRFYLERVDHEFEQRRH